MVTDLDLVKAVLVKDFDHFVDRRSINFGNDPILKEMLVMLEGQKWKDVRSVLSPTFTSGKIRKMFECFNKCGKSFVQCVKEQYPIKDGNDGHRVIVQDVVSKFTVAVIGEAAFGMDTKALTDPNSEFLKHARIASNITMWRITKVCRNI